MDEVDIPVCDVLSCEEIAQAWWEAVHAWPWRWRLPWERSWEIDAVADLIARQVIVAGWRKAYHDCACRSQSP